MLKNNYAKCAELSFLLVHGKPLTDFAELYANCSFQLQKANVLIPRTAVIPSIAIP